jgi:cytochrome c oxidase subunit II
MNEVFRELLWLPVQASTFARRVDLLHYFVISVTMLASLLIGGAAIYFMFRYNRRHPLQRTARVVPSVRFEAVIIGLPLAFFLLWFAIGYRDYLWYASPPAHAMDIYVMGKQWMWKFSYPGGPNAISTLHVPVGRPVRLLLTSRDVIHSFWVPAFRIKQDVLPGRYTATWFEATKPGRYRIMCAEYCGTWHSQMWGEVVALPGAEYDAWLVAQRTGPAERIDAGGESATDLRGGIVDYGKRVAAAQGCLKCHSVDGTPHIGPTWLDLYQRQETLTTGQRITADEAYLTASMVEPLAQIVRGFQPVMPSYRGRLAPFEFAALVEYIKSLRTARRVPIPAEEAVYEPRRR